MVSSAKQHLMTKQYTYSKIRLWHAVQPRLGQPDAELHIVMLLMVGEKQYLLSMKVISVMHVLMLAEICCDLTNFCVELDINVLLLAKQYSILAHKHSQMSTLA